jgi:hypothetical protein
MDIISDVGLNKVILLIKSVTDVSCYKERHDIILHDTCICCLTIISSVLCISLFVNVDKPWSLFVNLFFLFVSFVC